MSDKLIIKAHFSKQMSDLMVTRGLDRIVLSNKRVTFDLNDAVTPFKPLINGVKTKIIGETKQISMVKSLLDKPFKGTGVHIVNSFPSDLRAKIFAACVMHKAIEEFNGLDVRKRHGRTLPMWVRVMGYSSVDQVKMIKEAKPSLLIISNVTDEATPHKIERLRDILDCVDSIPKIVVTGGADPVTFFSRKLYYPIASAVRLGCNEKVNLMDL